MSNLVLESKLYGDIDLIFIAECYANYGFTEKLLTELNKRYRIKSKNIHKLIYSRDRILKEIDKIIKSRKFENTKIIAVIDFERGISRKFIEENFNLIQISGLSIYIGVGKKWNNVYAVIFDPRIEEAFICRFKEDICRNPFILRRIKSREAREYVMQIFKNRKAEDYLDIIIDSLAKALGFM